MEEGVGDGHAGQMGWIDTSVSRGGRYRRTGSSSCRGEWLQSFRPLGFAATWFLRGSNCVCAQTKFHAKIR